MGLATYKSCSLSEKRAVLRTFWSGSTDESNKVNGAAREYAPYALILVAVITFELVVIAALLIVRTNAWAGVATGADVISMWCLWWTAVCHRRMNARSPSPS
ncbi:MAG TPA: hypothetical protein VIJ86_04130 [Acidimicrobiales bacterium]